MACRFCHETFSCASQVERHELFHTGEKPYMCGNCGKSFAMKWNLDQHMRIHTGEKPYSCETCGKSYTSTYYLKRHQALHVKFKGQRFMKMRKKAGSYAASPRGLWDCHFCDMVFVCRAALNRHERVHTGEKPYSCEVCGKTFAQKAGVKSHMKTHLNI